MNLDLLSWTEAFLKYKDTIQRKIQEIEINKDKKEIKVTQKDGTIHKYECIDDLTNINIKNIENKRIVCLNTKNNLNWLINNWQDIKEIETTFIFSNPKKTAHWTVNPKIHNNITEKSAVKQGLKTLFESIPEI
jgi:hypothetical protein